MNLSPILGLLDEGSLQMMLYMAVPFVLSLTVHEVAHARTAKAFGDNTAHSLGRTSLNPLVHLDLWGTIALFVVGFGWAKPVPVNKANLRPQRMGDLAVSLAGPLSNLGLAIAACLTLKLLRVTGALNGPTGEIADYVLNVTIIANVALCVFNLLPLFPLDGHHVMRELLPGRLQPGFMQWQRQFGTITLLIIVFAPSLLGRITGNAYVSPVGLLYRQAREVFVFVGLL